MLFLCNYRKRNENITFKGMCRGTTIVALQEKHPHAKFFCKNQQMYVEKFLVLLRENHIDYLATNRIVLGNGQKFLSPVNSPALFSSVPEEWVLNP